MDENHDELLERALAGEELSSEEQALLDTNEELGARLEDLRKVEAHLAREGEEAILAEVRALEDPAPGESETLAHLRAVMAEERPTRGARVRWLLFGAAAAAAIVLIIGGDFGRTPKGGGGQVLLGSEEDPPVLLQVESGPGKLQLSWEHDLGESEGSYTVKVWSAGSRLTDPPLVYKRRIRGNTWDLNEGDLSRVPDEFTWAVTVIVEGVGVSEVRASGSR